MVAAKGGNYTLVVVVYEINSRVGRIECLCSVQFQHCYLTLPHCHLGIVMSQAANQLVKYCLSSAEIHLSTLYVNERW